MSYRKITVGTFTYQYTIGKKFVKFRSTDAILNLFGGGQVIMTNGKIVPLEEIGNEIEGGGWIVTPGTIKEYLLTGKVYNGLRHCGNFHNEYRNCPNMVSKLTVNPFCDEIYGKFHYRFMCDDCNEMVAAEI